MTQASHPDVYTAREIAAAAGVSEARVEQLMARGEIRSLASMLPPRGAPPEFATYVVEAEAMRAVRALAAGATVAVPDTLGLGRELFSDRYVRGRPAKGPLALSTSLHALGVALILLISSLGFAVADERTEPLKDPDPLRLVFLAEPGPGGGGGGGGLKMRQPPPKAEREGVRKASSPLPARQLSPPLRPQPKPPDPPKPLDTKPIIAPIATSPADTKNTDGLLAKVPEAPPSHGSGTGGGVGSGAGTGLGPGDGPGVGDGSGGGTGGGPYRPGSGVEPPRLLREVRANYTDEARRANIEGEVELEIVVRSNGTVGDIRVLRGLGGGLNERAVDAVRQWRFAPARLKGSPVDVIVEVSVEFRLR
jgi:TonB family protein